MWEPNPKSYQNGSALTSDHVGSNPTGISEWLCTYIWSCGSQSHSHIRMALHLHLTMEGTNPITMSEGYSTYIWPWKAPILSPCQKVSWTHHFPCEGTLIWRTPRFSLKYSNFILYISSIESHQGWLHPRITCELLQDRIHSRKTYKNIYVWATYDIC